MRNDGFFYLQRIYNTLPGIYNFATGLYQDGIGQGALPVGIYRFNKLVLVICIKNIIGIRSLLLLQELQRSFLFCRIISTNAHEFKISFAVHPVYGYKFREFRNTGAAPGSPDIDQAQLSGIIPQ